MRYLLLLTLILYGLANPGICAPAVQTPPGVIADHDAEPAISKNIEVFKRTTANIIICAVENGKRRLLVTGPSGLETDTIRTDGYVSGIIVFGCEALSISIGDREFSRAHKEATGGFSGDVFSTNGVESLPTAMQSLSEDGKSQCYFLFPTVPGDAISSTREFAIHVTSGTETSKITVKQNGIKDFCLKSSIEGNAVPFRYFGTRLDELKQTHADFENRLAAIAESIFKIQSIFLLPLVERVTILDYEKVHNAVTTSDNGEIWFYIDLLLNEPVAELYTIAAHESIHRVVSSLRLTESPEIRKLFAELKGFDLFSQERFMLVLTGNIPSKPLDRPEENIFFDFIDERNFLNGMKGGHSMENIGEFCTSVIHSLIHIENLGKNLSATIKTHKPLEGKRLLTGKDKIYILDKYISTIQCLIASLPPSSLNNSTENRSIGTYVLRALEEVLARKAELQIKGEL